MRRYFLCLYGAVPLGSLPVKNGTRTPLSVSLAIPEGGAFEQMEHNVQIHIYYIYI